MTCSCTVCAIHVHVMHVYTHGTVFRTANPGMVLSLFTLCIALHSYVCTCDGIVQNLFIQRWSGSQWIYLCRLWDSLHHSGLVPAVQTTSTENQRWSVLVHNCSVNRFGTVPSHIPTCTVHAIFKGCRVNTCFLTVPVHTANRLRTIPGSVPKNSSEMVP